MTISIIIFFILFTDDLTTAITTSSHVIRAVGFYWVSSWRTPELGFGFKARPSRSGQSSTECSSNLKPNTSFSSWNPLRNTWWVCQSRENTTPVQKINLHRRTGSQRPVQTPNRRKWYWNKAVLWKQCSTMAVTLRYRCQTIQSSVRGSVTEKTQLQTDNVKHWDRDSTYWWMAWRNFLWCFLTLAWSIFLTSLVFL